MQTNERSPDPYWATVYLDFQREIKSDCFPNGENKPWSFASSEHYAPPQDPTYITKQKLQFYV